MKKMILCNVLTVIAFAISFSQPSLIYNFHGLKAGVDNQMIYTEYADPGQSGADMIWNFGGLTNKQSFTGFLNQSDASEMGTSYTECNTELIEFESHFFFNVTASQIEEYGYSSADGKNQTRYSIPSIKMKFPFSYGHSFSGTFSGISIFNGVNSGTINGSYSVEADAYGALILPGNHYFESTLRVKTEKSYVTDYGSLSQQVDIVSYRWYDLMHRYPLLVLTEYSVKSGNTTTVYHQAAYNNNSITGLNSLIDEEGVSLYPNPTGAELMLKFDAAAEGLINIDIYNTAGNRIRSFQREGTQAGLLQFDLTDNISGLKPSSYFLIIQTGDRIIKKSFTLIE